VTTILTVAETRHGQLREISLELLTAGADLAAQVAGRHLVAIVDANADALADQVARAGVDEILLVPAPSGHFEAGRAQQSLETLIEAERPAVVLLGHTVDSLGFGPAVAARGGHGFASDVVRLSWEDGPVAERPAYGGKLVSELDFPQRSCTVLLLRAGVFDPAEEPGAPSRRTVDIDFDAARTEHLGYREAPIGDVDITKADFLLAIGRGIEDRDQIPRFQDLAERLGATLSVSRPLVDAGWIANSRQVGQSGKTVTPKVYLAFGISGAVQHLAGMRGAETIVAVNRDPEAPIFGVAHYGAVADLFDIVEELEQQVG
jgi:electron transfer flavoprotein alpha subunit